MDISYSRGSSKLKRACRLAAFVPMAALLVPGASAQDHRDEDKVHLIGRLHDRIRLTAIRETPSLAEELDDAYSRYVKSKKQIQDATGISYSMDASGLFQWGVPDGGYGSAQGLFTPSINWKAFRDTWAGSGSFQFAFTSTQYWSGVITGASLAGRLQVNAPINDFPTNGNTFAQVTYTHTFPGNWLTVSVGQYPMYNFDGNAYASNQQVNFINYSMSQNGSSTYPTASLGAYVQINPTKDVVLAAGFQDANNPTGAYIQTATFGNGQYTWFIYGEWSPKPKNLGRSAISVLYYKQPGVTLQPQQSEGLSISASQAIGTDWGLFMRANTTWGGSTWNIQSSIAVGGVYNNPLGRNPLDQIGLGFAWNKTNMSLFPAGTGVRQDETVLEAYWAWTISRAFQITSDVQLYFRPALNPSVDVAAVFSLRLGAFF
jgi:hypothetical protein